MTLTGEQFKVAYKERFKPSDRELWIANEIHGEVIKRSDIGNTFYHHIDPKDKQIVLCESPSNISGVIYYVHNILALEGAKFVSSLDEADIAVYFGKYICDYGKDGSPLIWPILYRVESGNLEALAFTEGRLYSDYCQGKCPEDKFMLKLIQEKKGINHLPLGYPYNKIPYVLLS
jgi:hypothetical protein